MVLVDSSVWIDYLRGTGNRQTQLLDDILGKQPILIGDLIFTEVLQGISNDKLFDKTHKYLSSLEMITIGGEAVALQAAKNYRALRKRGCTVRKTIDTLIATRCITENIALLHNDNDFLPFEQYLGLQTLRQPN